MNTTSIIGLVVAVALVAGGVWYFSTQGAPVDGTAATSTAETPGTPANGQGTFASLMGLTGSFTCQVSSSASGTESNGTVFIANGKLSGDFTSTVSGKAIMSHILHADGFMYTWSDAMPQGIKFADSAIAANAGSPAPSQGLSPDAQVSYSCAPWIEDSAKFTPPASVSFMDMSAAASGAASYTLPAGAKP